MGTTPETNDQALFAGPSRVNTTWDSLQDDHRTFIKYDLRGISDESIVTVGTEHRLFLSRCNNEVVKISKSVQECNKANREEKEKHNILHGLKSVWLSLQGKEHPMEMLASVKRQLGTLLPRILEGESSDLTVRIM
jgi:hypothetical protein